MSTQPYMHWAIEEHCNRSIDEAISEVTREIDVRRRCYDKWIMDRRLDRVDANDRMERLISALHMLEAVRDAVPSNVTKIAS